MQFCSGRTADPKEVTQFQIPLGAIKIIWSVTLIAPRLHEKRVFDTIDSFPDLRPTFGIAQNPAL
jgi:hypothetical protein